MSSKPSAVQIIIIDDDEEQSFLLERALRSSDQQDKASCFPRIIKTYTNPAEAVADLPTEGPAVILSDYNLGGSTGLDWLPHLIRAELGPVILMSSQGDERIASEAFKAGASDYLVKMDIFKNPWVLNQSIRDAMVHYQLEQCNRDLSHKLKTANHALELKNERLRELTDTAHRFVEDVAHEFRTPLTAIKEFASIISDGLGGPVTDKQVEYLGHIQSSSKNLAQMVDDFLDTSKLRAKLLRVDRKPHSVHEIFDSIRAVLTSRAQAGEYTLKEDIAPDLPRVFCDKEKTGRVLINLVINAIKFSPVGSTVHMWARQAEDGGVQIGVTDQGAGMSESDLSLLGNRLQQTSTGQRSSVKGFGLGLNIAKDLIGVNLSRMDVVSAPAEGSTFSFNLPKYDIQHILNRYLDSIMRQDPDVSITVLHAIPSALHGLELERARHFLACHTQSHDLVIPASDGRSIILLGPTSEPESWVSSIQACLNDQPVSTQPDRLLIGLDLRWVGTWSSSKMRNAVITSAFNLVQGTRRCA